VNTARRVVPYQELLEKTQIGRMWNRKAIKKEEADYAWKVWSTIIRDSVIIPLFQAASLSFKAILTT